MVAKVLGGGTIVLAGGSGRTMAFGPGHVDDSARPGGEGNCVLAGHRDTHFAFLRDLEPGDEIVIETVAGARVEYRVTGARVVDRGDLWVMDSTFSGNGDPDTDGGGIEVGSSADLVLDQSTFSGNRGRKGGGIYSSGILYISNTTFTGNSATSDGSNVGNSGRGGGLYATSSADLTGCDYIDNTAQGNNHYGDWKGMGGAGHEDGA